MDRSLPELSSLSLVEIPEEMIPRSLKESTCGPESVAEIPLEPTREHPIQKCNQDVLSTIFEWATCDSYTPRSRIAANIAMVCQRWRQVALQTPELWRYFDVNLFDRAHDIRKQWDWLLSVRTAPPDDICIEGIQQGYAQEMLYYIWHDCGLASLKRIMMLELIVVSPYTIAALLDPQLSLPDTTIENLFLDSPEYQPETGNMTYWEVSRLLAIFPRVTYLKFTRQSTFLFSPSHTFVYTTFLHIMDCEDVALCFGLSSFFNLERLWIQSTTISDSGGISSIPMPRLQWLCIHKAANFPWLELQCTSLEVLTGDEWVSPPMIDFLKRHPQLRDIDLRVHDHLFASFAHAIPHVESLDLGGYIEGLVEWQDTTDLVEPPFPNLKRLVLDRTDEGVEQDLFESIVRTYCLSPSQSNMQTNPRKRRLECLAIFGTTESLKEAKWSDSSLLKGCDRTSRNYSHLGEWICLELRWPEEEH